MLFIGSGACVDGCPSNSVADLMLGQGSTDY
jgi:hypothetical protein